MARTFVGHQPELLAGLLQLVGQRHGVLHVHVLVDHTVDEQQPTMPIAAMAPPAPGANAPPAPVHNGPANWIKVSAEQNGSFTVTNNRNGFSKTYRVETD